MAAARAVVRLPYAWADPVGVEVRLGIALDGIDLYQTESLGLAKVAYK